MQVNITNSMAVNTNTKKLVVRRVMEFTLNSTNSSNTNNNNHTTSEKKKNL